MPGTRWGRTASASTRSPGKPLEFRYYTRASDQTSINIVPYVSGWLEQIGIKLDAQTITSDKLGNVILAGTTTSSSGAGTRTPTRTTSSASSRAPQRPPDANTYRNTDSYYCNPEYDKLYQQQASVGPGGARSTSSTRCSRSSTEISRTS